MATTDGDGGRGGPTDPPKKKFPVFAWVLGIGIGLTVVGKALTIYAKMDRKDGETPPTSQGYWAGGATPGMRAWDREGLAEAVKGKTAAEVTALLGRPDLASPTDPATAEEESWYLYNEKVRNLETGKMDSVYVTFVGGKATGKVEAFGPPP